VAKMAASGSTIVAMGLCNSGAAFQRAMDVIMCGRNMKSALAYLDDLIVFSDSFVNHLANLREILVTAEAHGLQFTIKKGFPGFPRLRYLGHVISEKGTEPDPSKVGTIIKYCIHSY
jgi:hypothetical protein